MNAPRRTFTPERLLALQKAMRTKPRSISELAVIGDINKRMAQRYVDGLRETGNSHVKKWDLDSRGYPTIRLHAWGKGEDAPCPVMTDADRMRRRRAVAKKASPK